MKILLLAIRSLMRFRLYTAINIVGLALSLACVILIFRYIHLESTVDNYKDRTDRICMTVREDKQPNEERVVMGQWNPAEQANFPNPLTDPSVERAANFYWFNKDNIQANNKDYSTQVIVADSNFLKILDLPMLYGSSTSLTENPQNIVITEAFARKIFGTPNVIGKQVIYVTGHTLTVSGVIRELPFKSSFKFEAVVSDKLQEIWSGGINQSLVLLYPNTDILQLNARHSAYTRVDMFRCETRFQFMPMQQVYFTPGIGSYNDLLLKGNRQQLHILSLVAVLILIVGLFNFINIYTVVLLRRGKEIGLKKVFGGSATQLFAQLYIENFFMTVLALLIGWMLIELCGTVVTEQLQLQQLPNTCFDAGLSGFILLSLPLVAILYPFFRYKYASPIRSLRDVSTNKAGTFSRSLLLVFQYSITISLIIVSLFFVKQLHFMLNADLGYRTENVIHIPLEQSDRKEITSMEEFKAMREKVTQGTELFTRQMNASPLFDAWDFYTICPYEYQSGTSPFKKAETDIEKEAIVATGSAATFDILGIQTLEGRLWNDSLDTDGTVKLVLNQTAMKLFGLHDLSNAWIETIEPIQVGAQSPLCQVIGVVKDFQCGHMSKAVPPLVYVQNKYRGNSPAAAHIVPGKKQEAIAFLTQLHGEAFGNYFEYSFVSDEVEALYNSDRQLTNTYSVFAVIAILISSLGLFSLSLFDVQQRYREIAIRKINGATTSVIMKMLLRKYYKLLTIAFCISVPIAWLALHRYLEGFAHKAPISWWLFAIALLVTGGISLATLIWQIQKAARTNPADAIKTE